MLVVIVTLHMTIDCLRACSTNRLLRSYYSHRSLSAVPKVSASHVVPLFLRLRITCKTIALCEEQYDNVADPRLERGRLTQRLMRPSR